MNQIPRAVRMKRRSFFGAALAALAGASALPALRLIRIGRKSAPAKGSPPPRINPLAVPRSENRRGTNG